MHEVSPPAIVKETLSLSELAGQIKEMYTDHIHNSVQRALVLGAKLNSLKEQCGEQSLAWLPTLEKTGIPEKTSQTYMLVANNKGQVESFIRRNSGCNLSDILNHLKELKAAEPCDRPCRLAKGCKKCKKGPFAPPSPPIYPDKAKPVFDVVPEWVKIAKAAKTLGKRLRKLEGSLPFRSAFKGRKDGYLSDKIVNVYTSLDSMMPAEPCMDCDCNCQPNEDSEPCAACKGKGFFTAFDKRQKEPADASK